MTRLAGFSIQYDLSSRPIRRNVKKCGNTKNLLWICHCDRVKKHAHVFVVWGYVKRYRYPVDIAPCDQHESLKNIFLMHNGIDSNDYWVSKTYNKKHIVYPKDQNISHLENVWGLNDATIRYLFGDIYFSRTQTLYVFSKCYLIFYQLNASTVSCHIISGFKMGVRLRYVAFYAILLVNGLHHLPLFFARIMKSTHYLASALAALPCRLVRL